MMNNCELSTCVLKQLRELGVAEYVICPGARNSPLVVSLSNSSHIKIHSFVNENSGAFFAIGRMKRINKPVAVVTTSGTAVSELLPAVVEAYYNQLPLVLITADRPHAYRHTGSPQTIEQVGIFSSYVEKTWDLDSNNAKIESDQISYLQPIHINVAFAEPLLEGFSESLGCLNLEPREIKVRHNSIKNLSSLSNLKSPLIIVGPLAETERNECEEKILFIGAPVIAEALSGLRNSEKLSSQMIKGGESSASYQMAQGAFDSVIRFGGVPTGRLWRDLDLIYTQIPVFVDSISYWPGLSRPVCWFNQIENIKSKELVDENEKWAVKIDDLMDKYFLSEPCWFKFLSKVIPRDSNIYLGNSLPIREWELAATHEFRGHNFEGNRGANGIDGQLSTFLGWCECEKENWAIVGDLTALYDLGSLWITQNLQDKNMKIIVINNHGGQIFSRVLRRKELINSHDYDFSHWAKMWRWNYAQVRHHRDWQSFANQTIIEIIPDTEQTISFWKEYDSLRYSRGE